MTMKRELRVTMPDNSVWGIPVAVILADGRKHGIFRDETPRDDELVDWARNNMNWSDVEPHAILRKSGDEPDYDDGWANGMVEFVDQPDPYAAPLSSRAT